MNFPLMISARTALLHPLNPKNTNFELKEDLCYRIGGMVVESSKKNW